MVTATRALSLFGVRAALVVSLVALALAFLPKSASAQDATTFEGRRITRIAFDPRFQPLPEEELARLLPFKVGSALNATAIRETIQKLYSTGRYSEVEIDGDDDPPDGVVVTIRTRRTYFVSAVTIDGVAEPPTRGQLLTAAKLELGTAFTEAQLAVATENIQERLTANGLYDATVTHTVDRFPDTEEVVVHFKIDPGARARFDGVTLSGDLSTPPQNIIDETHWRRSLAFIRLPGWRYVTESQVSTGVNRVLESLQRGDHLEATVTLEDLKYDAESNTVTPSLLIDSGPILLVRTIGAKVSPGKLRQLVPIYQERTVDRSLLVEGRRNLVEYFQSQGYFDAAVDFHESPLEEGRETIDYSITLNDRHSLAHLGIDGNRYFEDDIIRERLEMAPARRFGFRFGHYSQRILDRDMDSIRDLYRSNGFRDVDVSAQIDGDYKGVQGHLGVILQVKEGPQWFVNQLSIEGAPENDLPYLQSVLQSTAGEPFSEANVAEDRDSILSYYYNNGYPDAAFDWSEAPGSSEHRVNLTYTITPGKREYIRAVIVRGLRTTRQSLVYKRVSLGPGDPISQNQVAASQQKLYDLGIFSKVQTAIQNPDGDEESKYLLFDVDEADRYSFTAGIGAQLGRIGGGVTTFDEPAGTTGFVPRISLGVSRLNLFGEGRTLSLQTRFSTIEQRVLLSYIAPQLTGNPNLTLTISGLFDDSRDIRTFAARRWEASMQLAQKLTRANSVQYRLTFRRVDISNVVISPELIPLLSQPEQVGLFSTTFIQDRRDDPVNSHRGIYNTIDVGIALRQLDAKSEFTRLLMRNSTYHPIGKNVVLARTLQFGWIERLGGQPQIPLAERFFAGGASSDRAFPDNQAGPRDLDTGFPLGGNALLMHSTELRFPLFGSTLGGVLFHDMGNVYDSVQDISFRFRQRNNQDFDYMVQSVGFGLRYKTPIGPLRVDFSFSPDAPRFFGFQGTFDQLLAGTGRQVNQKINLFQFHFSLGQTF
jgi:outer membrane protein assembly complex protein YaeT